MKRRHPITYAQMLKQFQQDTNFTMYDGYFSNIKKDMAEIKATYTPRQIRKSKFNFDSLVFEMALSRGIIIYDALHEDSSLLGLDGLFNVIRIDK